MNPPSLPMMPLLDFALISSLLDGLQHFLFVLLSTLHDESGGEDRVAVNCQITSRILGNIISAQQPSLPHHFTPLDFAINSSILDGLHPFLFVFLSTLHDESGGVAHVAVSCHLTSRILGKIISAQQPSLPHHFYSIPSHIIFLLIFCPNFR